MKAKSVMLIFVLSISLFTGCVSKTTPPKTTPLATTPPVTQTPAQSSTTTVPDVVTSASVVDNATAFEKAIGSQGTWIICITKDLTIDKDLVVDGEYKNGKKDTSGNDIIQRKIALYAQDADRNITARYTLTVPKFTIKSPEASIQHGTLKGDLYVSVKNFQLIDAKVDGNVYFTTDETKSTFKMDSTSTVTGKQELRI